MQVLTDKQALANLAANIHRLRGDRSLAWLAKEAGTYPINIARIENAESMPGAGLVARIAEALETTADALLSTDAVKYTSSLHSVR